MPISGSLIVGQSPGSPKNYTTNKPKFDELGFKHNQFVRHESEKQFTKFDNPKPSPYHLPTDPLARTEDEPVPRIGPSHDRARNS